MLAAASANAAIYTLTFTGPDFTTGGVVGEPVTQVLTALSPGGQGYPGGPMQSWNLGPPVSSIGGWIDFSSDGESINLEGGTVGLALAAASAFFSLGGSSPPFTLSFLDFPNNSGTQTYSITNVSCGATFGGCPRHRIWKRRHPDDRSGAGALDLGNDVARLRGVWARGILVWPEIKDGRGQSSSRITALAPHP